MPLSVVAADSAALQQRFEMSTLRAIHSDPTYEDGAITPAGPWTQLTDESARNLMASPLTADSVLLELVRPPDPANILETLADRLGDPGALYLGQALAPADALTTTPNHENDGSRIGLHVDNWDRLPYAEKHLGRRRLCLNLGPGIRYLLLANLDIRAICRAVHQDYAERYPHTDDLRLYIDGGHPTRCFRLRLAPGEGYIAPTELIPHDGSTQGQPDPSAAAFWLGHWPRGVLPSLL